MVKQSGDQWRTSLTFDGDALSGSPHEPGTVHFYVIATSAGGTSQPVAAEAGERITLYDCTFG